MTSLNVSTNAPASSTASPLRLSFTEHDPCTIIGASRCTRLWRAAIAQYCRDCINANLQRKKGKAAVYEAEDAALDDVLGAGRMLKRLCSHVDDIDANAAQRAIVDHMARDTHKGG